MTEDNTPQDIGFKDQSSNQEQRPENLVRIEQWLRWVLILPISGINLWIVCVIVSRCSYALNASYEHPVISYIQLADKYIPRVGAMAVLLLTLFYLVGLTERLTFSTYSEGAFRRSRAPWFPLRYLKNVVELIKELNLNTKQ